MSVDRTLSLVEAIVKYASLKTNNIQTKFIIKHYVIEGENGQDQFQYTAQLQDLDLTGQGSDFLSALTHLHSRCVEDSGELFKRIQKGRDTLIQALEVENTHKPEPLYVPEIFTLYDRVTHISHGAHGIVRKLGTDVPEVLFVENEESGQVEQWLRSECVLRKA